jgi:hypothetical protein
MDLLLRIDAPLHEGTLRFSTITLPVDVSPELAGLVVGVVAAIIGFAAVALLMSRQRPQPQRRVIVVPPYATLAAPERALASGPEGDSVSRATPLPPSGFPAPPSSRAWGEPSPLPITFQPSTALSARALAKMGIPVGPFGQRVSPASLVEVGALDDDLVEEDVVRPEPSKALAPHPLGVIPATAESMRRSTPPLGVASAPTVPAAGAAPIAELSFDDAPTEIGETFFDEPPQPRPLRSERPKIRPVAPQPPRYPESAGQKAAALPAPSPPPTTPGVNPTTRHP